MPVKIGVKLPTSGPFATAEKVVRTAVECDRLGYDSIWCHDHVHRSLTEAKAHNVAGTPAAWAHWEGRVVPNIYDSLTTLAYCAALTKKVQLGTSVLVLPLRNPVLVAKMVACIDQLSGGRFILGVGVGGYLGSELKAIGQTEYFARPARVADEFVKIIRQVWREDSATFEGEYLSIEDATVFPRPFRESGVPIWYGGVGAKALARVADTMDGWLPMFLDPGRIRADRAAILRQASEKGRDPSSITIANEHWMSIDTDATLAQKRVEATENVLWNYSSKRVTPREQGSTWFDVKRVNLVGDPDMIGAQIEEYEDAGVEHIVLRVVADDFSSMLEQLAMFKELVIDKRS